MFAALAAVPLQAQTRYFEASPAPIGFGVSLAISGDELLVGRTGMVAGFPMPPSNPGAIHLFRRSGGTWRETGTVSAPDGKIGDNYGVALAVDGTWLAVGASKVAGFGAVYVYERRGSTGPRPPS
jgi:hypothetical protein